MTTMNVLPNIKRMTIQQAARRLEKATDKGDSVMLWGSPGIGKTDIMYQLGARKKRKVIVFMLNIREPVDMRGIPVTDPLTKTTLWYYPSELPNVERDGEFGYLFLDEINASSPAMMAVAMQLVLEGKIGDYVLPKGWVVVAAGNLISDKAFAQRMPTALRNRFAHFHIVPDYAAWRVWAVANNVAPELIAF